MPLALTIDEGRRYGQITVIRELPRINKTSRCFECRCDCGAIKSFQLNNLLSGNTLSCGCQRTIAGSANPKFRHGLANHPLYRIWSGMIDRCSREKNKSYHRYGGRGITVCDEWRKDAASFIDWALSHGWQPHLQIDRENNDGNYEPGNCRFVTQKVNRNNR
jgi:hypothetical protein